MKQFFLFLLLAIATAAAGGCQQPIQPRTYDITVFNRLQEPITVFLTKNGPPEERGWLSPEELASLPIGEDSAHAGKVVEPGKRIHTPAVTGKFQRDTVAVLRVYRSVGGLEDISAISPGNPKRLDVFLYPGVNNLLIYGDDSGLVVQRDNP